MTTTEIAVQQSTGGPLAIRSDQARWDAAQLAALAQLGVQDAPQGDLDVFFHRCQRTQLDPFAKQIYMIGRNTKVTEWNNGRRDDRWETKYTIQTGIDGYRVLGNRLAAERGDELDHDEALWCGPDGQWVDIWLGGETPPAAAKYVIRKNGKPFIAKVIYSEYVQTNTDGSPNATWKKRPAGQLAKCAEALAWRMAYPQDFAGVELDAAVTIEPDGSPSPVKATTERVHRSAADVLTAIDGTNAVDEAQPVTDPAPPAEDAPADPPMTKIQQKKIGRLFAERGITDDATILAVIGEFFDRELAAPADVTRSEAIRLLAHLEDDPIATDSQLKHLSELLGEVGLTVDAEIYEFLSLKAGRTITVLSHLTGGEANTIAHLISDSLTGPAAANETAGGAQ